MMAGTMPITAPTDRHFLRARVKPGRRRGTWYARLRVLRIVVVSLVVACVGYIAVRSVMMSSRLRVARLVVRGNERLSTDDVMAIVDGVRGQNILTTNLDEWRARLLESSWVREVALHRSLPSTVEITIVERRPVGIGRLSGALYLVDEEGTIIDEYGPRYAELDLPVIDGLARGPTPAADIDNRRAALAARLLDAVSARPDLAVRISQVDVSDPRDAVVVLDKDTVLVRLGEDQFAERLQAYVDIAPTLRERVPEIAYVDLRFGERVYVGAAGQPGKTAVTTVARRRPPPG